MLQHTLLLLVVLCGSVTLADDKKTAIGWSGFDSGWILGGGGGQGAVGGRFAVQFEEPLQNPAYRYVRVANFGQW